MIRNDMVNTVLVDVIRKEVLVDPTVEGIDVVDRMAEVTKRMRGRLNIWPIVSVCGGLQPW